MARSGNPKSVYQKMSELKQTATFKPFFVGGNSSSSNNNSNSSRAVNDSLQKFNDGNESQQQQQTDRKSYTRDQARQGKASINDMANGRLIFSSLSKVIHAAA